MKNFSIHELELIGSVLYHCEGTKLRKDKREEKQNTYYYSVEFTNSNPFLIKLFLSFIRKSKITNPEKIKCQLFLYEDQNIEAIQKYWSEATEIPNTQFNKTYIFKSKIKYKPSIYGTCKVRFWGKEAFTKLNDIIVSKLGKEGCLLPGGVA